MEKDKILERIRNKIEYMSNILKFNKVNVMSYRNSRGKIRYKGRISVHGEGFNFSDMTIYDIDNLFYGILMGYSFALSQIQYDLKK